MTALRFLYLTVLVRYTLVDENINVCGCCVQTRSLKLKLKYHSNQLGLPENTGVTQWTGSRCSLSEFLSSLLIMPNWVPIRFWTLDEHHVLAPSRCFPVPLTVMHCLTIAPSPCVCWKQTAYGRECVCHWIWQWMRKYYFLLPDVSFFAAWTNTVLQTYFTGQCWKSEAKNFAKSISSHSPRR